MSAFALLDDACALAQVPSSRLYTGALGEHRCDDPAHLDAVWAAAAADLAQGIHLLLLADYEWGVRLAGLRTPSTEAAPGALRLLRFQHCARLTSAEVADWLAQQEGSATPAPAGVTDLVPDEDEATYTAAIADIHARIRRGETYQVNHTLRLRGRSVGSPLALYRRLRGHQPVPFGALIAWPEQDRWVLSCSPELFVRHHAGRLVTRPMKGTAPRHAEPVADRASADWLARDAKNRAENLMIVDLLRNDLGRLAVVGGVRVPALFDIEPYRTVYQMTSTVEADLPPATDLPAVLRAAFPCGSITGAPKHQTMSIIGQLESSPRGLYTGAIGWIEAPDTADRAAGRVMGDFCLSVAIRTLVLGEVDPTRDTRPVTLGVGGGIVLDSVAAQEAVECRHKLQFVIGADPGWTLFETLRVEGRQVLRLDAHLARLRGSAAALGFVLDEVRVRAVVDAAVQAFPAESARVHRLRIDLSHDGQVSHRSGELLALPDGPVSVLGPLACVPAEDAALLGHKTSRRTAYDAAVREAERLGAFDRLFVNARGELTEGARSTLLVRLAGRWYTPPCGSGVLPGVMRAALMADPHWRLTERVLHPEDLATAEALAVCNALRGVLPVQLRTTEMVGKPEFSSKWR